MLNTINTTLPSWYVNYGKLLSEQNSTVAVFSEDAKERLKQYLDSNSNLLEDINKVYVATSDGQVKEDYIELDTNKYKVKPGDNLGIVINKTDPAFPQIKLNLENEDILVGNISLGKAAGLLYKSMDGLGTDELEFASTLGAIHKSLADRDVSQQGIERVFNMFNQAYGTKEGSTLDEWIDGDFDGRDEACAMALAKRPIPKSILRGISWGTVFTDIGMLLLAIPTLGGSIAGKAALVGGRATQALSKSQRLVAMTNKAKAVGNAITAGKTFQRITGPMINSWKALSSSAKLLKTKALLPVGKNIEWLSAAGRAGKAATPINVQIMGYIKSSKTGKDLVKLQNVSSDGKLLAGAFTASVENLMVNAGKAGGMSMVTATSFAKGAGLTAAISKAETGNFEGLTGEDEQMDDMFNPYNPAELMGYYDQSTADPDRAMAQYKNMAAADLATQLHDAMDGWTDNSDELAIALMILSMDKVTANAVKKEYETQYGTGFYDEVIAGELEATMEELVGCYWAALTGDGPYVSQVAEKLEKITTT
jgi:hypothetical protein